MKQMWKVLVAGTLALSAWAGTAEAKEIKIGIVNLSLCCAYFVGMDEAIKDEAKVFPNVKVISTDAKGDVAKLTANVEDLLSQKVEGIIVSGAWLWAAGGGRKADVERRGPAEPEGRRDHRQRRLDRGGAGSAGCHQIRRSAGCAGRS